MDRTIVIARYNENIDWTKYLIRPYVIYNKGETLDMNFVVPRENVGRESETYVAHILEYYDMLPDDGDTVFLQGNPFDHAENVIVGFEMMGMDTGKGHPGDIVNFINHFSSSSAFTPIGRWYCCNAEGAPHRRNCPLYETYVNLFPEGELDHFWFVQGAQFIVKNKAIKAYPKSFYESLLTIDAHIMERLWPTIFDR